MYNFDDQITLDTEAILEVLTNEFDVPESDADYMLQVHGEDVLPVPEDCTYFDAAKTLLAAASDWGDYEDLLDL